jgi:hypothetical protein
MTPSKEPWYRSILTDHSGDFDMGAVLVGVVAIFMCINSGYDTWVHGVKFNAQEFGIGIAAMLGGFAAYKWGDAKRPDVSTTVDTHTRTTIDSPPKQRPDDDALR